MEGCQLVEALDLDCEQVQRQGRTCQGREVRACFRLQAILFAYLQQAELGLGPAKREGCAAGGLRVPEMPVWLLKHFGMKVVVSLQEKWQDFDCVYHAGSKTLVTVCEHLYFMKAD